MSVEGLLVKSTLDASNRSGVSVAETEPARETDIKICG